MSLLYGAEPATSYPTQALKAAPMRGAKTIYEGQFLKLLSTGSVATAAATDTGIYGIAAETRTTTTTEKTTKLLFYPADGVTEFLMRSSSTGAEKTIRGTVCAIAINTTSYYRIDPLTATAAVLKVIDVDSRDSGSGATNTAAGKRIRFVIRPSRSTYLTLGR